MRLSLGSSPLDSVVWTSWHGSSASEIPRHCWFGSDVQPHLPFGSIHPERQVVSSCAVRSVGPLLEGAVGDAHALAVATSATSARKETILDMGCSKWVEHHNYQRS